MPRVTITVPDKNSQPYRFALDRKSVTLGRGSDNDIVIDDGSASVNHAVMERIDGGYQLRDLGSTNGTKLDGKARDLIPLTDGSSVRIGDVAFDFSLSPEEKLTLAGETGGDASPILKEEAVAPRKQASNPVAPRPLLVSANQPSAAASFFMTVVFLLLAAGAFFVGMSIRHQKDVGRSLVQDIREGNSAPAASEAPTPAADPAPAVEVPADN